MNQQPSEQEMSFPGVLECFRLKTCAKLFSVWKSMIFKRRPRTKSLHDVLFWNLWFRKPSNLSPHLWPVTTQIVLFVNWGDYWGVSVGQWGNLMEWALFKHPPRHLWLALGWQLDIVGEIPADKSHAWANVWPQTVGRTWQPFVGGKNGHEHFRQAHIYNFRDKCVVLRVISNFRI